MDLADFVKNLSEQLQQVQSQLAERHATVTHLQATNKEQAQQIHALTETVAPLKAENKFIGANERSGKNITVLINLIIRSLISYNTDERTNCA